MHSDVATILSRAVQRCAGDLALTDAALASALGMPLEAAASLRRGSLVLSEHSPQWNRACQLVEIQKCLTTFWGDPQTAAAWMRGSNRAFGEAPLNVLVAPGGLNRLVAYVRTIEEAPFS